MLDDTLIITKFTEQDYHIPRPRTPSRDARAWALSIPAAAGITGLCAFSLLGLISPELQWLPDAFRTDTALIGALGLAVGGEIGTLFTNVEIFRKVALKRAAVWDWSAFVTSLVATILAFLLGMSALMPEVTWHGFVSTWLRIGLIMVAALDQYAGQMELGLYLGSYDQRVQDWEKDFHRWLKRMATLYGPGGRMSQVQGSTSEREVEPGKVVGFSAIAGVCWCGEEVGNYAQHLAERHIAEIRQHRSLVAARNALMEKYGDTLGRGDFQFLSPKEVKRLMEG